MKKFYNKNEILFTITFIIIYVVGGSIFGQITNDFTINTLISLLFYFILTTFLIIFIKNNNLINYYGLTKPIIKNKKMLYYIPLLLIVSCNIWLGIHFNLNFIDTIFYILMMFFVGILEELIFRGFLFKAMEKDNLISAIIVSSVTFGIGHIVNLFNGSGANLIQSICQVCYAIAIGFLFVIIFYKTKSIIPCIIAHFIMNALSAFSNPVMNEPTINIIISIILIIIPLLYMFYIIKHIKEEEMEQV